MEKRTSKDGPHDFSYLSHHHHLYCSHFLALLLSRNATLTPDHQQEALEILTRCHPVLLDDMCAIFDLKSANQESQLSLIHSLLDLGKYKEVRYCSNLLFLLAGGWGRPDTVTLYHIIYVEGK